MLAFLILVPIIILSDIPQRDVCLRYAPMAEAIAAGDWEVAFHTRVPPLFATIGSLFVLLFGCSGFLACKLASAMTFSLTVFPLWGIFRRSFDTKIAFTGCMLYIFCAYLLRVSGIGMRESTKCLGLAILAYGMVLIYQSRARIWGYIIFAAGAAMMIMTRDDSLLFVAFLGAWLLVDEIRKWRKFPWRSIVAGALIWVFLLPVSFVNLKLTGWFVPASRIPQVMGRFFPSENLVVRETTSGIVQNENTLTGFSKFAASLNPESILDFIDSVFKGTYFIFAIPALLMIIYRIRKKQWTPLESVVLVLFVAHTLLIILQIIVFDHYLYVSRRYLLPAAPLLFGWTALAGFALAGEIRRRLPRRVGVPVVALLLLLLAGGLYYDALSPQLKMRTSKKHAFNRLAILKWQDTIRQDYKGPARLDERVFNVYQYHSFRRPTIASDEMVEVGYLAGGEGYEIQAENDSYDYIIDYVLNEVPVPVRGKYTRLDSFETNKGTYILWKREWTAHE